MPTVIDALVITLGLDPSDFKRGSKEMTEEMKKQKKESEKLAKDMEAAGKKAASFFGSIKNELLALAGVTLTLGGIRSFVLSTADSLSKLGYAAQNLGMSSKELDGWQKSFAKFGAGAEQVGGSMAGLQNDLALLQNKGEISQGLIACLNCNRLVRYAHLGFKGDLFFADMIGSADPVYDELGSRFVLFYATEQEIAAA